MNKFLLAGDKLMLPLHLTPPELMYSAYGPFSKNKKEYKNLKKHEIQDIFIKTNKIKLAFNMTWLKKILNTWLEEQLLINYYAIKHLMLLKIRNMMDINAELLQWFVKFLI